MNIKYLFSTLINWLKSHIYIVYMVCVALVLFIILANCVSCSHFSMKVDKIEGAEMVYDNTGKPAETDSDIDDSSLSSAIIPLSDNYIA